MCVADFESKWDEDSLCKVHSEIFGRRNFTKAFHDEARTEEAAVCNTLSCDHHVYAHLPLVD